MGKKTPQVESLLNPTKILQQKNMDINEPISYSVLYYILLSS